MTNIPNIFFAQLTYHIQSQLTPLIPHPSLLTTIVSLGGDSLSLRRVHERVVHEAPIVCNKRRDEEWRRWPRPAVHSEPVSPIRSQARSHERERHRTLLEMLASLAGRVADRRQTTRDQSDDAGKI